MLVQRRMLSCKDAVKATSVKVYCCKTNNKSEHITIHNIHMKGSWRKSRVDEATARKSEFHAAAEPATYTLTYLIPFTTHTAYVVRL